MEPTGQDLDMGGRSVGLGRKRENVRTGSDRRRGRGLGAAWAWRGRAFRGVVLWRSGQGYVAADKPPANSAASPVTRMRRDAQSVETGGATLLLGLRLMPLCFTKRALLFDSFKDRVQVICQTLGSINTPPPLASSRKAQKHSGL
ncbi:hypothetical protein GGTG_05330 [Gaeumannomyces tritici R3-111a-1]|uniref:Uncharacterized protein n=1 Tax=Gaeumannomyces tritici (strain R3-111a-1) TaxID=644352 RepID=J3NVL5_GAET3|nr:hypothetical protein GGTG_05330 [Gaeumannomyces tritici R3-111a-1]EJT75393.1 hypothetical protein GGTG_05330 [Gaeumannomyces tritici R3-111a-1]